MHNRNFTITVIESASGETSSTRKGFLWKHFQTLSSLTLIGGIYSPFVKRKRWLDITANVYSWVVFFFSFIVTCMTLVDLVAFMVFFTCIRVLLGKIMQSVSVIYCFVTFIFDRS